MTSWQVFGLVDTLGWNKSGWLWDFHSRRGKEFLRGTAQPVGCWDGGWARTFWVTVSLSPGHQREHTEL